jgi:CobQ-like glutamine amidotransferase family enzyme
MKQMFNILVLYPEHLNLNGDVANAGVLARRFNWYGLDAAIDFLHPGDPLPGYRPDVIILGHGSAAAWSAIEADLVALLPQLRTWIADGCYGLAVNSGQERLHSGDAGVFAEPLLSGDRVSKFAVAAADEVLPDLRVLGYQNSVWNAPLIERTGNFIGTQLHGPVLAKNSALADWIIRGVSKVSLEATEQGRQHLENAAAYEAGIWALEEPQAKD